MTLEQFLLDGTKRQAWVTFKKIDLYVRRGRHVVNGNIRLTLDFANLEASERHRSSGDLWRAVELAESLEKQRIVFIENVHSERLVASLVKKNWSVTSDDGFTPSFYRENKLAVFDTVSASKHAA
jgi:hypothetical protein